MRRGTRRPSTRLGLKFKDLAEVAAQKRLVRHLADGRIHALKIIGAEQTLDDEKAFISIVLDLSF